MLSPASIRAAAWQCFEEGGDVGLSLRRVAARLSVSPMALYRHFADKQALVDALVTEALADWRTEVAGIAPASPAQWLAEIAARYLDFALRHPRRFEAAFLLPSSIALRYPDDFLAGKSPAGDLELDLLERLTGRSASADLAEQLVALTALTQGLVTLYRSDRIAGGEAAFRALFTRQVALFLANLRAGAAA